MEVGGQRHAPAALPRERSGTHFIGGWVGPRAGLERCGISRPPPGFDPRTVQPVACRSPGPLMQVILFLKTTVKVISFATDFDSVGSLLGQLTI